MGSSQLRSGGLLSVVGAVLCGIAGCIAVQGEDEHVEHHVPEHRPKSFAAAVEQVRLRHHRIAEEFQTAEIDSLRSELSEMNDIIGWLPELAADGPMMKFAWDQVHAASRELAVIYKDATAALNMSPRGKWPGDKRAVDALIKVLARQISSPDDVP